MIRESGKKIFYEGIDKGNSIKSTTDSARDEEGMERSV